jgi:hypothetical protein
MQQKTLILGLVAVLALGACNPPAAKVTASPSSLTAGAPSASALEAVKAAAAAVGFQTAGAFHVTWASSQIRVSIENSALNGSTHSARNSEAVAIADAISAAIANKPEFAGALGISVAYVARDSGADHTSLVDTIDFRKDSAGRMTLHTT